MQAKVCYVETSPPLDRLEGTLPDGWMGEADDEVFALPADLIERENELQLKGLSVPLPPNAVWLFLRNAPVALLLGQAEHELWKRDSEPVPIAGLTGGVTDAVLSSDGELLLSQTFLPGHHDVPALCLALHDARSGAELYRSPAPDRRGWSLGWSSAMSSFLTVGGGSLGRLSAEGLSPLKLPPRFEEAELTALATHPTQPLVCVELEDEDRRVLLIGDVLGATVDWRAPVSLRRGSEFRCWVWHPTLAVLAGERVDGKDRAHLEVLDTKGRTLASHGLYSGWSSEAVAWSGDGRLVAAVHEEHLAYWRADRSVLDAKAYP